MTSNDSQHPRRSIVLIGFRGSGKSVVGRELVKLTGGELIDTDELIAQQAGKSIVELFDREGERAFRRREEGAVRRAAMQSPSVISVGGGAVLSRRNVELLRSIGYLVWLTAPAEVLWQRINSDPSSDNARPPLTNLSGVEEVQQLLTQRTPHYAGTAHLTVDTTSGTPSEMAAEIVMKLDALTGDD
ncbi:MAG: shikimate kinase [Phycisphaerales bacterium]|nr:MAG: shikimate kinase [Phycisphaerales bacterium]